VRVFDPPRPVLLWERLTRFISVRNLHYRYSDGTKALNGVDFDLEAGECVILLGPNGSGKTTFALHLNGLLRGEGEVIVCGQELNESTVAEIRRKVGIVFQDPDDQLFLQTVLEDVCFGPLNLGLPTEEAIARARRALARAGMDWAESKAPYQLSAGEKRRVAIAGVLAMEPEILVLDEPTTSLDPPAQSGLLELLARLPQPKIVATHDAGFARALGTRAVFFDKGKVAAEGPVGELIDRFQWEALRR
jgi:cobalt/nickel transport system ATP-binding protein